MTADIVLSSILALYLHGFSTFVQPVVSLSFKMLVEQHCWSLVLRAAMSGTCGVGTLEAKLPAALRGGPLSTPTFTTGELPSNQSAANRKLMNS